MAERTKFSMQWHITDRCDQRCKHCYIYEGKDKKCGLELDLDTLKAILEDFLQTCDKLERDPFLVITGGDPLLYKRIWDFLEILKEKEVHFGLQEIRFIQIMMQLRDWKIQVVLIFKCHWMD